MKILGKGQLLSRQLTIIAKSLLVNITVLRKKETPKVLYMFSACQKYGMVEISKHDLIRNTF